MSAEQEEAEGDALAPWRTWLHQHVAELVPGLTQAWCVAVEETQVTIEVVLDASGLPAASVAVGLGEGLAALSIVPVAHALNKRQRVYTGDADLDDAVVMHVPEAGCYGAFDAGTRQRILALVQAGMTASGGALRLLPWATRTLDAELVGETLDEMITLATELAMTPDEAREGITRIIDGDPNGAVRQTYDKAFGAAPDVRDARARLLRAEFEAAGKGDALHFQLLLEQARDKTLGIAVRQGAIDKLITDFPLERLEGRCGGLPRKLGEALVHKVCAIVKEGRVPDERLAGARILMQIVREWSTVPHTTALELATVVGPLGEPQALEFLIGCTNRVSHEMVILGFIGLMRLPVPPDWILPKLKDAMRLSLIRNAPAIARDQPAVIGDAYLALLRHAQHLDSSLIPQYLQAMSFAYRDGQDVVATEIARARDVELARELLDHGDSEIQEAALDLLAKVGTLADLPRITPLTEGFFRAGAVKAAARVAVATIRVREKVREESGALTLADESAGGLAVSADER